jgi:hypothetical protein
MREKIAKTTEERPLKMNALYWRDLDKVAQDLKKKTGRYHTAQGVLRMILDDVKQSGSSEIMSTVKGWFKKEVDNGNKDL